MPMQSDIVILGGGLAGMTLALQIRSRHADARICVIERRTHPVPISAHKVGESTVEIGAHYLADVIGLREHLESCHLRKYGLRLFFDAGSTSDLAQAGELGASHLLTLSSYQIDRGVLENHLAERLADEDIELIGGATVRAIELAESDDDQHQVRYRVDGETHTIHTRWVIDAMSRGSIIKRHLDLAEDNGHECSSVWFRIADRIDIGQWSESPEWQQRCNQLPRWLSTNHLVGPGYWVWLIPLASGSTSIGIVFDNQLHDFNRLKTWEGTLDWLAEHQPMCRQAIEDSDGQLQDFLYLRNFSHGCKQVFSPRRWALTGEAGVFLDPFYSPGSDFIAISNTYITDLVCRDLAGEPFARRARLYERSFFSFYQSSLQLYRDQYPLFGHARAMSAKTIWDYAYYWAILALFVFSNRLTDTRLLVRNGVMLDQVRDLHAQMQSMFRHWAKEEPEVDAAGLFVNQSDLPLLVRLNRELAEVADDDDARLDERLADNCRMLHALADELRQLAPAQSAEAVTLHRADPTLHEPLLNGLPERFTRPPATSVA